MRSSNNEEIYCGIKTALERIYNSVIEIKGRLISREMNKPFQREKENNDKKIAGDQNSQL